MDISTRTRCSRPSRRFELLQGQWEQKRYHQHRTRVNHAAARIDFAPPQSSEFQHIKKKSKKLQREEEKAMEVMVNNMILLKHLVEIALSKRVNDGMRHKSEHKFYDEWNPFLQEVLCMRRKQLEHIRQLLQWQLAHTAPKNRKVSSSDHPEEPKQNRPDEAELEESDQWSKKKMVSFDQRSLATEGPSSSSSRRPQPPKKDRFI